MGGAAYAWGVFADPLVARFGWTTAEAKAPFTVFMVVFAASMVPAGRLQDRWGPRPVAAAGAVLFLLAYGLAALVGHVAHPAWLPLTYGLVGGTACGLTYATIAPTVRKWFPDRPGLAISFALTGFGLAAALFASLKAEVWLVSLGLEGTLLLLAVVTSAVSLAVALIPAFGTHALDLSPLEAASAITVLAVVNGLGRPLAGWLSDRVGAVSVLIPTYALQAAALLTLPWLVVDTATLYGYAAIFGWGFAVTLALFPVLTSVCFGVANLGFVYGLLFTAFGAGALGPVLGSWLFDATGSYTPSFVLAGALATLALALGTLLRSRHALR